MKGLNKFSVAFNAENKSRGFDAANENVGQTLMLIVSELSEALDAHRSNRFANLNAFLADIQKFNKTELNLEKRDAYYKMRFEETIKDSFEDELADTFLRVVDFTGALRIDLEKHIELKAKYNRMRGYKHGKQY